MLTPEGLTVPTLEELVASLGASVQATFGPDTNIAPDSVFGQFIGVFAAELASAYELDQQQYDAFDPDQAEGTLLDNLAGLVGVVRNSATSSTATAVLTGTVGTLIDADSIVEASATLDRFEVSEEAILADVALVTGSMTFSDVGSITRSAGSWLADGLAVGSALAITGSSFNDETFTISAITALVIEVNEPVTNEGPVGAVATVGMATVTLVAEETGPIQAPAQTIDGIVTPISGWDTVINISDAIEGQDAETNPELRARREGSLQVKGASVDNAIRANILDIDDVEQCLVISNRSDTTQNGIPPHAFETIIHPDTGELDYQELIAQTIFNLQPAGIQAFGDTTYDITDTQGIVQQVAYSFANGLVLYVECNLSVDSNYPADGNAQVAAAILAEGGTLSVGNDVIIWRFISALDSIPGILTVDMRIEAINPPTNTANIAVDFRSIADFDSSRITVNS